jgi:predicted transport protein
MYCRGDWRLGICEIAQEFIAKLGLSNIATQKEMLQSMLANLKDKTGNSLQEWLALTVPCSMQKHGELMKLLKGEHGVTHGFANLIAPQTLDARKDSSEETDLVTVQYAGPKAALFPIYQALIAKIQTFGNDVELAPKKAYVSLRRNKQFALIQPSTKTRIDVGINLKDIEAQGKLENSGSFNGMVSHRVRLESIEDISPELIEWLHTAYLQLLVVIGISSRWIYYCVLRLGYKVIFSKNSAVVVYISYTGRQYKPA